jgi:hypothetical protein
MKTNISIATADVFISLQVEASIVAVPLLKMFLLDVLAYIRSSTFNSKTFGSIRVAQADEQINEIHSVFPEASLVKTLEADKFISNFIRTF